MALARATFCSRTDVLATPKSTSAHSSMAIWRWSSEYRLHFIHCTHSHNSEPYVDRVQEFSPRLDQGAPVPGYLFILRKAAA